MVEQQSEKQMMKTRSSTMYWSNIELTIQNIKCNSKHKVMMKQDSSVKVVKAG
jgi:hypothetical protein